MTLFCPILLRCCSLPLGGNGPYGSGGHEWSCSCDAGLPFLHHERFPESSMSLNKCISSITRNTTFKTWQYLNHSYFHTDLVSFWTIIKKMLKRFPLVCDGRRRDMVQDIGNLCTNTTFRVISSTTQTQSWTIFWTNIFFWFFILVSIHK